MIRIEKLNVLYSYGLYWFKTIAMWPPGFKSQLGFFSTTSPEAPPTF